MGANSSMDDLIAAVGPQQPRKQAISTDAGKGLPHVEVGPEALKNYKPIPHIPDPSYVEEKYLRKSEYHYRWVHQRKIDYRRFQGYEPVMHEDCPVHQKTAEGFVRMGDCIFMKVPMRKYEQTLRDREDFWKALYNKKLTEAYNAADQVMPGSPYVVDPETGKEIS